MRTQRTLVSRCSLLVVCGLWCCMPVQGQSGSEYPRTPWGGYPYPASYDAEIADPDVHRVLFENENIMFLEVSNPPELDVQMHGHPYPSVFARDTGERTEHRRRSAGRNSPRPDKPLRRQRLGPGTCALRVAVSSLHDRSARGAS